jgi:hypothetical protein
MRNSWGPAWAAVFRDGLFRREVAGAYSGTASIFRFEVDLSEPGTYEVAVYAFDPRNGNCGLDRVTFMAE